MKTGKVAKMLNKDANTITDWTDRFPEFFSPDARRNNRSQREYRPEDLIVLNTIRVQRDDHRATWEDIRILLQEGKFENTFPPNATPVQGETAIVVYAQLRTLEAKLDAEKQRADRAEQELSHERARYEKRIDELTREATEWKVRYDVIKEELDKDE